MHPALVGFRKENLLSCFTSLCNSQAMTRGELAAATELSIMTTGKIADAMIECGILCEEKHPCTGAGRRPGTLRFVSDPAFLILNLSSRRFSAYILSAAMQSKLVCLHDYNDIFPFDDNLLIFLNAVRRGCDTSVASIPYLAVITAPEDDKRQCITRSLHIAPHSEQHMLDFIAKIMRRDCDLVVDEITAAQHYLNSLHECQNVDCGAFINLSDMTYAAVWMRGNVLLPRICRIGELMLSEQKRISDALTDAICTEDAILPTAYAISSLETFFTPDCIVLESNRFRIDEPFLNDVYKALVPILPTNSRIIPLHASCSDPCAAVCGCAYELRRKWFFDLTGLG